MSHSDAWFPCYTADLLGSMRWKMMTPAQRGAYWQLICWQMQSPDGHLCAEASALSRLADIDLAGENECVLECFPMNGNGRRANPRALSEWEKRQAISGKRATAGKKGTANRWQAVRQKRNKAVTSVTTSTSTSTGEQPEPKKENAPGKPSQVTWMTPYAEIWNQKTGGEMQCAKFAKDLAAVRSKHGDPEALRVWAKYLDVKDLEFANAADFRSKFGSWDKEKPRKTGTAQLTNTWQSENPHPEMTEAFQ